MAFRFRNMFKFALPARFRTGEGELLQGVIAMILDASLQRVREATQASLPTQAGDSALALHGLDRAIRRGRSETRDHYAQRLLRWRWPRGHRVRGSDFALLEQISEYFGGMYGAVADAAGSVYTRAIDGTLSWAFGVGWNWDGAGASPQWGRFWVTIDPSGGNGVPGTAISATPALGDPTLWGGGYGVDGQTIGLLGVTPADMLALRELMLPPTPWKPAGTRSEWLIINVAGTSGTPDGTWGRWSKLTGAAGGPQTQVAARFAGWRYVSLAPEANNTEAGLPSQFATHVTLPDGTTYDGHPASFPTAVTLPDGTVYTGNPNNFPAAVRLVDDGSQP